MRFSKKIWHYRKEKYFQKNILIISKIIFCPYLQQKHQTTTNNLQNAQEQHNSFGKRFFNFFPLVIPINWWQINKDGNFSSLSYWFRWLRGNVVTNDNSQILIMVLRVFHVVLILRLGSAGIIIIYIYNL